MSLPVFPGELPGMAYPRDKESAFANLVQSAPNGLDTVVQQTRNPVWKWTLIYELLRDNPAAASELINGYTEYEIMQGFQLALGGSAGVFLLTDPKDNYIGPGVTSGTTPNLQAQLQVVNDGASSPTYYSPIQRNFGGQFYEDVTDLNGTFKVYDNGTLKTLGTDYTIIGPGLAIPGYSFMGMVIQWAAAPTGPVTGDGHFYFRVRFAEDSQDFSRFDAVRWTIGGENAGDSTNMILKSARPVLV